MYDFECVVCFKVMEAVDPDHKENCQPYGGGEIRLIFGYGSFKFDTHIGTTEYCGVICDECSARLVSKMKMSGYDIKGEKI